MLRLIILGLMSGLAAAAGSPRILALERLPESFDPAIARAITLAELRCGACHEGHEAPPAPVLDTMGARLQPDWIRRFLTDPPSAQPGTTMPDLWAGEDADTRTREVEALTHYLVSLQGEWKPPRIAKFSDPHAGGRLFRRLGCAACHADPINEAEPNQGGLRSLHRMAEKYSHAALTDFLMQPEKHRPAGRMPNFELTLTQATDVAAYLTGTLDQAANDARAPLQRMEIEESLAQEGARLFESKGCAHCHAPEAGEQRKVAAWETLDCRKAHYALTETQRALLAAPGSSLSEPQQITQTLALYHCHACHDRGDLGGPAGRADYFTGDDTLGNEGRFPPSLDGVGAKFQAEWFQVVLQGHGAMRPYMHTKMPRYQWETLAAWVDAVRRVDGHSHESPLAEGDAEAGRQLLGTEGGVGCITCHTWQERQGLAMQALALTEAPKRYEFAWFRQHLIAPQTTRPGTLMPSFWPEGVAGNTAILNGDAEQQISAIWAFLEEGGEAPPGYPDFDPGTFEIIPRERPVIQRTFMKGVSTHAIAVGFPGGPHLVYDAESCRVIQVWRGRFMDAYKTWFSRLDPTATPLGKDIHLLPASDSPTSRFFRGYVLDDAGIPTFLYEEEGEIVREQWTPNRAGGFTRSVTRPGQEPYHSTISW